jgi:hypothetical protein
MFTPVVNICIKPVDSLCSICFLFYDYQCNYD